MHTRIATSVVAAALLVPSMASAHLELLEPTARYDAVTIKNSPCGEGDGERGDEVTVFEPGETITVEWDEYIDHPGHYRIAFDEDGTDDLVAPECLDACNSAEDMQIEEHNNDAVLLDGIADESGGTYQREIELPDVTCDNCTLQVIQVMYDKPPYTLPGNDIYYTCADLMLEPVESDENPDAGISDAGNDGGDAGLDGDGEGACTATGGFVPQIPLFAAMVLMLFGVRNETPEASDIGR